MRNKKFKRIRKRTVIPFVLLLLFFVFKFTLLDDLAVKNTDQYLTILHTNDIHGRLLPLNYKNSKEKVGGAARRAQLINKIRNSNKNVMVLDAGDSFQGSLFFNLFKGKAGLEIFEKIDYDTVELGNHEFDNGIEELKKLIMDADYPYICSNLVFNNDEQLDKRVKDYVIKDYNGFKVGVIGVITPEVVSLSKANLDITVEDPVESLKKTVMKIDPITDLIVVLSHCGLKEDSRIAKFVQNIDVIIGGHSHTLLEKPKVIQNENNKVLIFQAGAYGANIGRLDLKVKKDSVQDYFYDLLVVDKSIEKDKIISNLVNNYSKKIDEAYGEKVGVLADSLDATRNTICSGQSPAGQLLANAVKHAAPQVDITLHNAGSIRANKIIKKGDFNVGNAIELYPFSNDIIVFELKGKDLLSLLERSSDTVFSFNEHFLYSTGLEYTVDCSAEAQKLSHDLKTIIKEGNRVKNVLINNEPLDRNKYYKIAANDFIFYSGDGMIKMNEAKNPINTKVRVNGAIVEYFKANSPVKPYIDGKIHYINK